MRARGLNTEVNYYCLRVRCSGIPVEAVSFTSVESIRILRGANSIRMSVHTYCYIRRPVAVVYFYFNSLYVAHCALISFSTCSHVFFTRNTFVGKNGWESTAKETYTVLIIKTLRRSFKHITGAQGINFCFQKKFFKYVRWFFEYVCFMKQYCIFLPILEGILYFWKYYTYY